MQAKRGKWILRGEQFGIAKRLDQSSVGSKRKDLLVLRAWAENDRLLRSDGGVLRCIPCHCKGAAGGLRFVHKKHREALQDRDSLGLRDCTIRPAALVSL